jgi:hypothetical protein
MAVNTINIQKYMGPGKVYLNCYIPPVGTNFFQYATNGVPSGGVDIGATQGESTFNYQLTVESLQTESSGLPLMPYGTDESASITFACAEPVAERMRTAILAGTLRTPQWNGNSSGASVTFGGGGTIYASGQCLTLVAERGDCPGKYVGVMLYNAIDIAGLTRSFKKGKEAIVQFTFQSFPTVADYARGNGEIVGQFSETL